MGYRSNVAFVLCKCDFDRLVKEMRDIDIYTAEYLENNATYMTTPDEIYVKSTFEWYKWYDSYKEVRLINGFLSKVRHSLIILGEDDDDVTTEWVTVDDRGEDEEFYEFLHVIRDIGDGGFVADRD